MGLSDRAEESRLLGVIISSNTLIKQQVLQPDEPLGLSHISRLLTDCLRGTRIGQKAVGCS